jgi:hypothetical protein
MSEQPQEPNFRQPSLSPIREAFPSSSTQTVLSSPATHPQMESTIASAPSTSNRIIYPLRSPRSSPPRSPSGEQSKSPAPAPSVSPPTEDSSRRAKLPCPNKLAQEKPLPSRIIQISPQDFNSFREVLEEYKLRNLLLVSESKLTTREDIVAHFK